MQLQYQVAAQAIERDGKKYALIEIIDESENKNRWRINPAGKARALAGLLTHPLLGPPRLGHGAIDVVGRPVDFTSNHATQVLYEIPDASNWERIRNGEWDAVSPQLTFLRDHFEDGTQVIDEWRFDHVAFVEQGAFPNTGVKSICEGDPALCGFSKAVTAALQGHGAGSYDPSAETDVGSYSNNRQGTQEKIGDHTGGVIVKNSETKEVDTMSCEHDKVIAELTDKNKTLQAELEETKTETVTAAKDTLATIQAEFQVVQAEMKAVKVENETLKAWKAAQEDTEHMKRVQGVVDIRVKTGLLDTKNIQAAIDTLKKLPNEALDEMQADLSAVQGKFESLPAGPKARLIPSVSARFNPLQATVGDLVGQPIGTVKANESGVKA